MEGVRRYQVRLLKHNSAWEKEFLTVARELESCWGDRIVQVQHVGSTAIRTICAKPILDVAVQLKEIQGMDIKALTDRGYDYRGPQRGNPNYHLFVLRGEGQMSLRHIHCYDRTEKEFALLVGFRDYLNTHPETAMQYEKIKLQLAEKYPGNRAAYTAGKETFIQSIYSKLQI